MSTITVTAPEPGSTELRLVLGPISGPPGPPGSGSGAAEIAVEDDGVEIVDSVATLNFTGAGVTVTDGGSGQVDVDIAGGSGLALGETSTTAYRGDRGKTAYDHTLESTTAHGGIVADDDVRLSDDRNPTAHSHPISDVTGLQTELDAKAATSHTHAWGAITGKPTEFPPERTSEPHPLASSGTDTLEFGPNVLTMTGNVTLLDPSVPSGEVGDVDIEVTNIDAHTLTLPAEWNLDLTGYTGRQLIVVRYRDGADPAAFIAGGDFATAAQGALADTAVQPARTVNAKPLSADVTLNAADVGADAAGSAAFLVGLEAAAREAGDATLIDRSGATGFYPPPFGNYRLRQSTATLRHVLMFGDSTAYNWSPEFRRLIGRLFPGETIHAGLQPIWNTTNGGDSAIGAWSFAGTWSKPGTDIYNLAPYANPSSGNENVRAAAAAADIATWTKPAGTTVNEVDVFFIDHSSGTGATNWSYSVDGGSSWINGPTLTRPATAAMVKHTVTVANPATFRIRGANAAGSAATIPGLLGIAVRSSATGIQVNHCGRSDSRFHLSLLGVQNQVSPRSWHAWADLVQPLLSVVCFTNDFPSSAPSGTDISRFEFAVDDVVNRLSAYGDVVLVGQHHQNRSTPEIQADKRARQRTIASTREQAYLDMTEIWGDYTAANGRGWMSDVNHLTAAGGAAFTAQIGRFLRAT